MRRLRSGSVPGALATYVDAYVAGIAADLRALSGADMTVEVVREADSLVAAVIDADGRHSAAELDAWIADIGARLTPPVIVTPTQLREINLLTGRADWLQGPSEMARLLIDSDARDGGRRAVRYYELTMRLAHATAAVDLVPSLDEIAAIDHYRNLLLAAFDGAGIARPGRPASSGATGHPGGTAAAGPSDRSGGAPSPAEQVPPQPPAPEARPLEELLAELDELIGLESVKTAVRRLTSLLRVEQLRHERDLPTLETSHHLVFTGNPGTGKTTVARLLSAILHSLGLVSRGHLVETDRSHLVAGYVGQTATTTRAVLESALGGTLLIDEAYALARGGNNDFGREAIDTLVKFMEDHRADLAVIAAGYPAEMTELVDANPGLKSRFTRTLHFPDYTDEELVAIFERMSGSTRYHLDESGLAKLREVVADEPRTRGFGNARFVRNVFEEAVGRQAERLAGIEAPTDEQLTTLTADDIVAPSAGPLAVAPTPIA